VTIDNEGWGIDMSTIEITVPETVELTLEESRAAMSDLIGDRLGVTRDEFLANIDAGIYAESDDIELLHLITLAPFAR